MACAVRYGTYPDNTTIRTSGMKDRREMDATLLLSGFSGLFAAFVASALWATRPAPERPAR